MPRGYGSDGVFVFEKSKSGELVVMAKCESKTLAKRVTNALTAYLAGVDNDKHEERWKPRETDVINAIGFALVKARSKAAAETIARALNVYRPRRKGKDDSDDEVSDSQEASRVSGVQSSESSKRTQPIDVGRVAKRERA